SAPCRTAPRGLGPGPRSPPPDVTPPQMSCSGVGAASDAGGAFGVPIDGPGADGQLRGPPKGDARTSVQNPRAIVQELWRRPGPRQVWWRGRRWRTWLCILRLGKAAQLRTQRSPRLELRRHSPAFDVSCLPGLASSPVASGPRPSKAFNQVGPCKGRGMAAVLAVTLLMAGAPVLAT